MLYMGNLLGGSFGLHFALIMALITNGIMFFFSDKIVLRMYGAQPLDRTQYPHVYEIVQELSAKLTIPMPKVWLVQAPHANAFATGRNPSHGSIALTDSIIDLLDIDELRGVLAHELGHIKNRDILVATIAATIATTISYLGNMIQRMLFWRAIGGSNKRNNNPIGLLITAIFIPIIATLLQLAVSRSREYLADETGAHCSQDPLALASALKKLQAQSVAKDMEKNMRHATTASLFIVNPFVGKNWSTLFSTHPPIEERVKRLEKIFEKNY